MSVLVIEDDSAIRTMLMTLLEDEGYPVIGSANGLEAMSTLQDAEELPCLILLDLMMPLMNGWDFRAAQMAEPRLADIPIVLLSADGKVAERVEEIGALAYLHKPLDFAVLLEIVERYCSHCRP